MKSSLERTSSLRPKKSHEEDHRSDDNVDGEEDCGHDRNQHLSSHCCAEEHLRQHHPVKWLEN